MVQREFVEAEAGVEARNSEKRNSEFAIREINQEFESQRLQLHQASRWAYKISLYGELKLRNRLFQGKPCKGMPRNLLKY